MMKHRTVSHAVLMGLIAAPAFAAEAVADNSEPLVDMAADEFTDAEMVDDGQRFSYDLGDQRRNWNHRRWSIHTFDEPRDLTDFNAIRLSVRTDEPRDDAGVFIAIRESEGDTWYYHAWAASLNNEQTTATVFFDDFALPFHSSPPEGGFFDDNMRLDLDAIDGVAIGTINPLGIGELEFTVTEVDLVKAEDTTPRELDVHVTGRPLAINDTDLVPAGLFGSYNLPDGHTERYRLALDRRMHHNALDGSPRFGHDEITHIMVNTMGDRVRPSPRLTHSDWEQRSREQGRRFAEAAKERDETVYVEYYNEPYLNWANRNRAGFINRFYDESKAEEGGPVHIKHDGEKAPHLRWTRDYDAPKWNWLSRRDWRRGRDEDGRVYSPVHAPPYGGMQGVYGGGWQPNLHPPEDVEDGETYEANGRELEAFTPWHIYDETQFTFWSGKGMLKFYNEPMRAVGEAMKEVDADTVYMVGWGFRPGEDHWAAWDMLYKPTIDEGIDVIDAVVDHDYGGSPVRMAAHYEVVTAYGVTEHDKWLYNYNTETAMGSDPQAYPDVPEQPAQLQADRNKFEWTMTKMLHALQYVPDKARGFMWFGYGGNWWSDGGEGVAMDMLRNLRGQLVDVDVPDDQHLYVVAAIDGTDPQNPRPDNMEDRKELVVAVINDHPQKRTVNLRIDAPQGASFTDEVIVRKPDFTKDDVDDRIVKTTDRVDGDSYRVEGLELDYRGVAVYTFPLRGEPDTEPGIQRHQAFVDSILQEVGVGEPHTVNIQLDPAQVENAERAAVRIVGERLQRGEGAVTINGTRYELPAAPTPANHAFLRQLEIDVADLREDNELVFEVADERHAGFLLGKASLVVDVAD